ncbi:MAG: hemolysin family protein [Candidatus Binatia bacterium]
MFLQNFWLEALLIFILILANGFFAASEIAIIAMRKTRVDTLREKGVRSATAVARLKNDPDRFLATVQIGITVVATLASAIGGAAAIQTLKPLIQSLPIPWVSQWGELIALLLVVVPIAYFSLVLGELFPKSLALRFSEQIACLVARPIDFISRLTSIVVKVLTASSDALLWLFGGKNGGGTSFISEEEVKILLREGAAKGIFDETEKELIHSVFEFVDTPVKAVMVPRTEVHVIDIKSSPDEVMKSFVESGFSRIPVIEETMDRVVGIVYNKDLFRALQEKGTFQLQDHLHPPFYVPSSLPISQLLRDLQRRRIAMAIVINEFGEVEGVATIEDLLEEIVGEIRDEYDHEERGPVEQLPDGSMVIQGSALLKDLRSNYGIPFEESQDYRTLAGFVLAKLQRIPRGGERVEHNGYRLTIVDMDGRRIVRVRMEEARKY